MSILKPAEATQARAKINISGFSGSGKTYAAIHIAKGIMAEMKSTKPLAFFDTETGSDFFIDRLRNDGIEMVQAKTRAFVDLCAGLKEALNQCDVAIIDSVTHYWKELVDSYMRAKTLNILRHKNIIESPEQALTAADGDATYAEWLDEQIKTYRSNQPTFGDWNYLKAEWNLFTTFYVNSQLHIISNGRGGYEYDYSQNDDGKMELRKVGTKMKVESEFGFEPSLVLECERVRKTVHFDDPKAKGFVHKITVLKDRWDQINGEEFVFDPVSPSGSNPIYDSLKPHIGLLNLDGKQLGVETSRSSLRTFKDGDSEYNRMKKLKDQILEEIKDILTESFPGQTKEEKQTKIGLLNKAFGARSWTTIEGKPVPELRAGLRALVDAINKMREEHEGFNPIEYPSVALEPVESENSNVQST